MRTKITLALLVAGLAAAPAEAQTSGDGGCRPTRFRPTPVILLHGTFTDPTSIWGAFAPKLIDDGFCVYTLNYGDRGTASVPASATEVAQFARRVLRRTGARRVSFVGHAQGGMLARYVARFRGMGGQINDIVALAPPSHGTTTPLVPPAEGIVCQSCKDQAAGSPVMNALAEDDEAPAPIAYTVVMTRNDSVITPLASQAIAGSGEVTNSVLQDRCTGDPADHGSIVTDVATFAWVHDALTRRGPAAADLQPRCPAPAPQAAPKPASGGPQVLGSQSFRPHLILGSTVLIRSHRVSINVGCEGASFLSCVTEVEVRVGTTTLTSGRVVVRAGRAKAARLELRTPLASQQRFRLSVRATTQNGAPAVITRTFTVRPRV